MLLVTDFIYVAERPVLEKPRVNIFLPAISENCAPKWPHTVNWLVRIERSLRRGFCGGSRAK